MSKRVTLAALAAAMLSGCGTDDNVVTTGPVVPSPTPIAISSPLPLGLPNGPATPNQVLRGRYLVTSAGCADCHNRGTDNPNDPNWLAGVIASQGTRGQFQIGNVTVRSANLTPDLTGQETPQQTFNALRNGVTRTGRPLFPPMPWQIYNHMVDDDLWSIAAYLQSIKPVSNAVPAPNLPDGSPATANNVPIAPNLPLPAFPAANEIEVTNQAGPGLPTGPATRSQVLAGRYLVTAATDCAACHSVRGNNPNDGLWLAGYVNNATVNPANTGRFPIGGNITTFARNLTPDASGLGTYTGQQIFNALRLGTDHRSGGFLLPPMPWPEFRNFTDSDLWSMVAYLQSLRPVANTVPSASAPGPIDSAAFYTGLQPLPPYPGTNEVR